MKTIEAKRRSIAVIGSFRQHNLQVQQVCSALRLAGFDVTSPKGKDVIEEKVSFVRFVSDDPNLSDSAIQSLALHRIFRANLIYVVAPDGYIGRTTCYEIGRAMQISRPIYFSSRPLDLPLHVRGEFVVNIESLVKNLLDSSWQPKSLFQDDLGTAGTLENDLIAGVFRDD